MNVKKLVRDVKHHNEMTNEKLAKYIGVSVPTISNLLNEKRNASFNIILSIARLHPKGTAILGEFK